MSWSVLGRFAARIFALALLLVPSTFSPVHAGAIALSFTGGGLFQRGSFENFGWSFDVTQATEVTALGFFDFGSDGLADPHQTGIWNSGGNLLASATITSADPLSPSGVSAGGWRFQAIAPLDLGPGSYVIGSFFPTIADLFIGTATGITTLPQIVFQDSLASPGVITTFAEPLGVLTGSSFAPGFFGPNFEVPEPPGFSIMVAGLLGLIILRAARAPGLAGS